MSVFTPLLLFLVILLPSASSIINQTPTPTFAFEPMDVLPFPILDCDDIESPFNGPTWGEITIGSSSVEDLKEYLHELNETYDIRYIAPTRTIIASMERNKAKEVNSPSTINACVDEETQKIIGLAFTNFTLSEDLNITDLIIEYGEPDIVSWDVVLDGRLVIWLEQGFAASINVDFSEEFHPYGYVKDLQYFPYQSLDGYQDRWPYTHLPLSAQDLVTLTPSVPHVSNPFDFDVMIATITAQPTRTLTPTFTPRTPARSRTPTPTSPAQTTPPIQ